MCITSQTQSLLLGATCNANVDARMHDNTHYVMYVLANGHCAYSVAYAMAKYAAMNCAPRIPMLIVTIARHHTKTTCTGRPVSLNLQIEEDPFNLKAYRLPSDRRMR